jgi:glycine dehydrogenase subunit 1
VKLPVSADTIVRRLAEEGIAAGISLSRFYPDRDRELLVAVTEMNSREDIDTLVEGFARVSA